MRNKRKTKKSQSRGGIWEIMFAPQFERWGSFFHVGLWSFKKEKREGCTMEEREGTIQKERGAGVFILQTATPGRSKGTTCIQN